MSKKSMYCLVLCGAFSLVHAAEDLQELLDIESQQVPSSHRRVASWTDGEVDHYQRLLGSGGYSPDEVSQWLEGTSTMRERDIARSYAFEEGQREASQTVVRRVRNKMEECLLISTVGACIVGITLLGALSGSFST